MLEWVYGIIAFAVWTALAVAFGMYWRGRHPKSPANVIVDTVVKDVAARANKTP